MGRLWFWGWRTLFLFVCEINCVVYSIVRLHWYSCPDLLAFCARMRSSCSLLYSCLFPLSLSQLATASAIPISCVLCLRVCGTNRHNWLSDDIWCMLDLPWSQVFEANDASQTPFLCKFDQWSQLINSTVPSCTLRVVVDHLRSENWLECSCLSGWTFFGRALMLEALWS